MRNLRRPGDKGEAFISYPGDDGTEPPEVRAMKAKAYADMVLQRAEDRAQASARERESREKRQEARFVAWLFLCLFLISVGIGVLISVGNALKSMGWM